MKNVITIDELVDFLNEIAELDRSTLSTFMQMRARCTNKSIPNHPTIQVHERKDGVCLVGMLGLLNGLFGKYGDGFGPIVVHYDEDDQIECFEYYQGPPAIEEQITKTND